MLNNENMMDSLKVGGLLIATLVLPPIAKALKLIVEHNKEFQSILTIVSLAYVLYKFARDVINDRAKTKQHQNEQPTNKN